MQRVGRGGRKNIRFRMALACSIAHPPNFHRKAAAPAHLAVNRNIAAHNIYHTLDQGQPQAVALRGVRGVALIELLENAFTYLWRDTTASVRDPASTT